MIGRYLFRTKDADIQGKNVDTKTISPALRKGRKHLDIHWLEQCNSAF